MLLREAGYLEEAETTGPTEEEEVERAFQYAVSDPQRYRRNGMLRVDQDQGFVIRHKVLVEHRSIRSVAREMGISRNTVSKYLEVSAPVRKETSPRDRPVTDKIAPRIDEILSQGDGRFTPKQRLTGTRIHRQLIEDGYQTGVTVVRDYLREKRRRSAEVFIPLIHRPGEEGQVDFFERSATISSSPASPDPVRDMTTAA